MRVDIWRYDFGESYSVDNVKYIELRKNTTCVIGQRYQVSKVNTLFCYKEDGSVVEISVSKSLIRKMQKTPGPKKYDILRFYFYLKHVSAEIIRYGDLCFFDIADVPKDSPFFNEEAERQQDRS